MKGVELAHMTWPVVAAAAKDGWPVIVPIGTVEAQGLHAPMGHDHIVAEALGRAVSERIECVVTPTIPFGYSHFSKPFAGTISLRPGTLYALLEDLVSCLAQSGFNRFIFINNHSLNEPVLGHVADEMRERHGVLIASVFPSQMAADLSADLYEDQESVFAHGGEPTVSLMMHLTPEAMQNMDQAGPLDFISPFEELELAGPGAVRFGGTSVKVYTDIAKMMPTGGAGDPRAASADKGLLMFERMTEVVAEFVKVFIETEAK